MMTLDDYRRQILEDTIKEAKINKGNYESFEDFAEDCWTNDNITGNGSGSYTCNTRQAEENLTHVLFDPETQNMFKESGFDHIPVEDGAEAVDVMIRCGLLGEVLDANESEIKKELGL